MHRQSKSRNSGFTLVEMLMVIAVLGIMAIVGIPALHKMAVRSKLEGAAKEVSLVFQNARLEAVKRGVPVVALIDTDLREVRAFADVNLASGDAGSDLLFNPDETLPRGSRDYQLFSFVRLGTDVEFAGEAANREVVGFTADPDGGPNIAVFEPDGSIRNIGAFRLADSRGNILEARVSPRATARVQVRKYNEDYTNVDGSNYHEKGNADTGDALWEWYLSAPEG